VTYTGDEAEGLWFCRSEAIAAKRMHRSKSGMAGWHLSELVELDLMMTATRAHVEEPADAILPHVADCHDPRSG
jgi:hypothetical protein